MKFTTRFEKWLAIVVSMALLITCLAVPMVVSAEGEELNIWNGETSKPAGYDEAAETDIIEINNAAELAYVVSNGTAKPYTQQYKLTADIYLNDVSVDGWETGADNNAWYEDVRVRGVFDGDGHTVYGLWNNGATGAVGLFPVATNSLTIKNLAIKEAYLVSAGAAGAFVGSAVKANSFSRLIVDNCFSDATVTTHSSGKVGSGGILGYAYGTGDVSWTFSNTYSFAKFMDDAWANYNNCGAIVGEYWGNGTNTGEMTMTNCYGTYKLLKVGSGAQVTFNNCYCRSDSSSFKPTEYPMLSAANMQGAASLINMPGLGDKFVSTATYPVLATFAGDTTTYYNFGELGIKGAGTEADPYLISNAQQLEWAIGAFGYNGKYFKLTNNIIVNSAHNINLINGSYTQKTDRPRVDWFAGATTGTDYVGYAGATGTFKGTLDGDGYFVSGLYLNTDAAKNGGLIPVLEGTVKNIGLKNSYIKGNTHCGALAGVAINATISGCYADETVTVSNATYSSSAVGGLVGRAWDSRSLTISDSWAASRIIRSGGESKKGGLIGNAWSNTLNLSNVYSAVTFYSSVTNAMNGTTGTLSAITEGTTDASKATISNVFAITDISQAANSGTYTQAAIADMTGAAGLAALEAAGLDVSGYYAVEGKTPRFITAGITSGDVDKDGSAIGEFDGVWYTETKDGDMVALSNILIGKGGDTTTADFTRDSNVDICDLVGLAMYKDLA